MDIIFLEPLFKQAIWGGNRLRTVFGYDIPGDNTGECWAISAHPNGDCRIKGGEYDGWSLSRLWNDKRELFGNAKGDIFPILTKIIDAKEDLSISVHPDDEYASEHENGSPGKTECWYILDCTDNAEVIIGHNASTKEELKRMVEENRWEDLIRRVPVRKGDFFQINSGCIHAIKGGIMLYETEQNSDITYRFYDYDRLSDGKKRELHIDKALEVVKTPFREEEAFLSGQRKDKKDGWLTELISCYAYTVWKGNVDGEELLTQDRKFMLVSVTEGGGNFNGTRVKTGDSFILPYGLGKVKIKGRLSVIISTADFTG